MQSWLEAIAIRLEAIAIRLEATAIRLLLGWRPLLLRLLPRCFPHLETLNLGLELSLHSGKFLSATVHREAKCFSNTKGTKGKHVPCCVLSMSAPGHEARPAETRLHQTWSLPLEPSRTKERLAWNKGGLHREKNSLQRQLKRN